MAAVKIPLSQRQLELLRAQQLRRAGKFNEAYEGLNALDKKFENDIAVKKEILRLASVANDSVRAQQIVAEIKNFEGPQGTSGDMSRQGYGSQAMNLKNMFQR